MSGIMRQAFTLFPFMTRPTIYNCARGTNPHTQTKKLEVEEN